MAFSFNSIMFNVKHKSHLLDCFKLKNIRICCSQNNSKSFHKNFKNEQIYNYNFKPCSNYPLVITQNLHRLCHQNNLQNYSGIRQMSSIEKENAFQVTTDALRWQLKNKENQLKEAKDDIVEEIQETKAKVKEKMEIIIERENIWTFPNLLCVGRIVASPFILWMVMNADYQLGLACFLFAGFTDLIDGQIARIFPSQASRLGSFLDPLADKILVAALFFGLTYQSLIPINLTALIIYRDICIIGGACYVRYTSLPPPKTISRYFEASHATAQLSPTTISKLNTVIQLSLITAALAAPVYEFQDHFMFHTLCAVTAVSTLASGISYIFSDTTYRFIEKLNDPKDK